MTATVQSPMQYRRFGRTELKMPVFSTGGMRYQDGWKDKPWDEIDPQTQENLRACIHRSLELGIHHIETARGYGPSERQLAPVLAEFPREKLIIQTKVGPSANPDEFRANVLDSLDRLQQDYVDLLSIHGINHDETFDWAVGQDGKSGCLAVLRELQQRKRIRFVGFSTHGTQDVIRRAITHDDGHGGFDYFNVHWYYILRRNWPAIADARKLDKGVFIISPTDKGGKLYEPSDKLVELCAPLHPIVFNDLWCLSHPQVHTLSLGAARPSDYDLHMEAVSLMERTDELVPPIVAKLEAAMRDAVGHDHPEADSWDLPDHREAPGGLNMPLMLWLANLKLGWDMEAYGKMRFNMIGNGGHWFPGSKPKEVLPTLSDDAIVEAAGAWPQAKQLPDLLRRTVDLLGGEEVKRQSEGG